MVNDVVVCLCSIIVSLSLCKEFLDHLRSVVFICCRGMSQRVKHWDHSSRCAERLLLTRSPRSHSG